MADVALVTASARARADEEVVERRQAAAQASSQRTRDRRRSREVDDERARASTRRVGASRKSDQGPRARPRRRRRMAATGAAAASVRRDRSAPGAPRDERRHARARRGRRAGMPRARWGRCPRRGPGRRRACPAATPATPARDRPGFARRGAARRAPVGPAGWRCPGDRPVGRRRCGVPSAERRRRRSWPSTWSSPTTMLSRPAASRRRWPRGILTDELTSSGGVVHAGEPDKHVEGEGRGPPPISSTRRQVCRTSQPKRATLAETRPAAMSDRVAGSATNASNARIHGRPAADGWPSLRSLAPPGCARSRASDLAATVMGPPRPRSAADGIAAASVQARVRSRMRDHVADHEQRRAPDRRRHRPAGQPTSPGRSHGPPGWTGWRRR